MLKELEAHTNAILFIAEINTVIGAGGTAGGAIQALAAQKLSGKVAVSGQDADIAAVRRVIAGSHAMTVYQPLKLLAPEAAKPASHTGRNG